MKSELLKTLKCLKCSSGMELSTNVVTLKEEIVSGKVICTKCKNSYLIDDGVVDTLPAEGIDEDETDGWRSFAKKENWHQPSSEYLSVLPFGFAKKLIPEDTLTWDRHCRNFFRVLSYLDLNNKEVLDVGAGRCWSTKYLALQGAKCTAQDLMKTEYIGLKTGNSFINNASIYFERVRSDMSALPFCDAAFDIAFASGSIHHASDIKKTIFEMSRILKKGGILALVNEDCSSPRSKEICEVNDMPGIHEHRYRAYRLYQYLCQAGFGQFQVVPDVYYHKKDDYCFTNINKLDKIHPFFIAIKLLLKGGVYNLLAKRV